MEKTIKVTGRGKLSLKPDWIRLQMDLEDCCPTYSDTMKTSAEHVKMLREIVEGLGFEGQDLRTTHFSVDTKYESSTKRDGSWTRRFVGYECSHKLVLEFGSDKDTLNRVLSALAQSPVRPELGISYTVKDPDSAKEALLSKAVSDSAAKARVLTQAAGVVLGDLISIDYSWGEIEYSVRPMGRMESRALLDASASCDMEIEPENLNLEDTVTVLWQIR